MEITGTIRAICPQCGEPRLNISANTETKEILLKCSHCDHEESLERTVFRLSTEEGSVDLLSQIDEIIKDGLPPEKENPFWLEALADGHGYLKDLLKDPDLLN